MCTAEPRVRELVGSANFVVNPRSAGVRHITISSNEIAITVI